MNITFSPQGRDSAAMTLSKTGDVLTINGTDYDLSVIPDGATLPDAAQATGCDLFAGEINRENGVLNISLILPHDRFEKRQSVLFPAPIMDAPDGQIVLPTEASNDD